MTALKGTLFHCPVVAQGSGGGRGLGGRRRFHIHLSKQAKGEATPTHPPPPQCSPRSLGRATLAEAKFTFLCGAWGCVQSQGSVGQE